MFRKLLTVVVIGLLLIVSSACQGAEEEADLVGPTATLHPLFSATQLATPTQRPTQTPLMTTATPVAISTTLPPINEIDFVAVPVFIDSLSSDWSIENSSRVDYAFAKSTTLLGEGTALRFTPTDEEAVAYFSLNESGANDFPRSAVFGVSFSVNGGSSWLRGRDVGIAIVGSNENDYWIPGDTSVESPFNLDPVFSETGLHFLGIDGSIPPQNWVPLEIFLDDLMFDPVYENVIAFYFKFAPDLRDPVYIKDIQILLLPEELREEAP